MKIGLVVSEFNSEITKKMEKTAIEVANKNNVEIIKKINVPGAYDMPLVVQKLAELKDIEAIVCLGAIIKGQTDHDKIIAQSLAKTLHEISLSTKKPVLLGVIGPGADYKKAQERATLYATRAINAAIKMKETMKNI